MNDRFHEDDDGQRSVRNIVVGPGLYGPYSMEGRYVYIDKGRLATILQKQFAVDTVMQRLKGDAAFVEEKIVRWPGYAYRHLTLETKSCTIPGYERDGWMVYGKADLLNYAMCQENGNVLVHLIPFQELKDAFWPECQNFEETTTTQRNQTACRKVPLHWIEAKVGCFKKLIHATPEGVAAVQAFNQTHYKNRPAPITQQASLL